MDLDDMKRAWAALDAQLERHNALALDALRDRRAQRARGYLWPTRAGLHVRIIAGVALIVVAAAYWVPRWGVAHLVAWGWMLQILGLLLVVTGAVEARMLAGIDYAGPVVVQQRRLAELSAWRLRLVPVWTAAGAVGWIPALLAAFDYVFGADIAARSPEVVIAFFASAIGATAAARAIARYWPAAARYLGATAVGGGLTRLNAELEEIARFEQG